MEGLSHYKCSKKLNGDAKISETVPFFLSAAFWSEAEGKRQQVSRQQESLKVNRDTLISHQISHDKVKLAEPAGSLPLRKIFVGGIGSELTKADIRKHFAQFGPVKSVNIIKKTTSWKRRGFCFVLFKHQKGAEKALLLVKQTICGCKVEIKLAYPRNKPLLDSLKHFQPFSPFELMSYKLEGGENGIMYFKNTISMMNK